MRRRDPKKRGSDRLQHALLLAGERELPDVLTVRDDAAKFDAMLAGVR